MVLLSRAWLGESLRPSDAVYAGAMGVAIGLLSLSAKTGAGGAGNALRLAVAARLAVPPACSGNASKGRRAATGRPLGRRLRHLNGDDRRPDENARPGLRDPGRRLFRLAVLLSLSCLFAAGVPEPCNSPTSSIRSCGRGPSSTGLPSFIRSSVRSFVFGNPIRPVRGGGDRRHRPGRRPASSGPQDLTAGGQAVLSMARRMELPCSEIPL